MKENRRRKILIKIISKLESEKKKFENPLISKIASNDKDPYKVLISCILSLRTRDKEAYKASERLFSLAKNPREMAKLSEKDIENAIKGVNYYKTKAKRIKEISEVLLKEYNGNVPKNIDELLKLKGVGRKTANIVLSYAFGKDAIAVDTHVHRISNRLGVVKTKYAFETEKELMKILSKRYWKSVNQTFVTFGQNICLPRNPKCNICKIRKYCKRVGVK
ncbi:MAG: endonuclease III [Candidatus Aenigmatarchaeota archaeon]|nr:endonuclease III [Candidatus Aenigmarchaeota archaeon]